MISVTGWRYQKALHSWGSARIARFLDGDPNTCFPLDEYHFTDSGKQPTKIPVMLRGTTNAYRKHRPFNVIVKLRNLTCQEAIGLSIPSFAPVRVLLGSKLPCTTCGLIGSALHQCQLVEDRHFHCRFRCECLSYCQHVYLMFNALHIQQTNAELCEIIQGN